MVNMKIFALFFCLVASCKASTPTMSEILTKMAAADSLKPYSMYDFKSEIACGDLNADVPKRLAQRPSIQSIAITGLDEFVQEPEDADQPADDNYIANLNGTLTL